MEKTVFHRNSPLKAIVQRISEGRVTVDGETIAECGRGLMVLLGVAQGDTEEDAALLAGKITKMRIFSDENGKMNLSVLDIGGGVMVVPNFTLLASYRKGNRPDYLNSASPDEANRLFEHFTELVAREVPDTTRGRFGADMKVSITNDGPVTIPMDSDVLKQPKRK
ncbi:MAG: D-aminoacyl-tRNA deacylase [Eubacteriales bacterium]